MNTPQNRVRIYTDGACLNNPGPGGWGAVLLHEASGVRNEISGGEVATTNNRMELTAAIKALQKLKYACEVDLFTDSTYLKLGITEWLPQWKSRGWKTASKKPVKNVDLWQALEQAQNVHHVRWHWVRGHAGDQYNEQADNLANAAIALLMKNANNRSAGAL